MIVCICKVVTERDVDAAIDAGARTSDEVARATGAGTDCGYCLGELEARVQRGCARRASGACGGCAETVAAAG